MHLSRPPALTPAGSTPTPAAWLVRAGLFLTMARLENHLRCFLHPLLAARPHREASHPSSNLCSVTAPGLVWHDGPNLLLLTDGFQSYSRRRSAVYINSTSPSGTEHRLGSLPSSKTFYFSFSLFLFPHWLPNMPFGIKDCKLMEVVPGTGKMIHPLSPSQSRFPEPPHGRSYGDLPRACAPHISAPCSLRIYNKHADDGPPQLS